MQYRSVSGFEAACRVHRPRRWQSLRLAPGFSLTCALTSAFACVLWVYSTTVSFAGTESTQDFSVERTQFENALKALERDELATFESLYRRLEHYPIAHYLEYKRLRRQFTESPDKQAVQLLNDFETVFADEALTRNLTRHLQRQLIKAEDWPLFLGVSKSRLAGSFACASAHATAQTTGLKGWSAPLLEYWSSTIILPELCSDTFAALEQRATPSLVAIWERLYNAISAGKLDVARGLQQWLSTSDSRRVGAWIDARESPKALLTGVKLQENDLLNRRAILDLVRRWSWQDPHAAIAHWQKINARYSFFDDERYELSRELALRGAWRRLPVAYEWLHSFDVREDDLEVQEWRIRAALLAQQWDDVLLSINALSTEERTQDHWAWWHGRALEQLGRQAEADEIFAEVAILPTYYGFLSADKLGLDYQLADRKILASEEVLETLSDNPGLIRAREYLMTGIPWEGRREWKTVIDSLETAEVAATAVLAERWKLPDRAIASANAAGEKAALSLRFPVVFESEVDQAASDNRLDPALIYAIMRRESAFIPDIKSPVGAMGLMQLMPKTARYVADMMGRSKQGFDLTEKATNIDFGSFYMRHVLDKFDDHLALGAASYNAGPHRTKDWLPTEGEIAGDLWVDTIPFTETRRYVRAVLAYMTVFEWRIQQEEGTGGVDSLPRMSTRLPVVHSEEELKDSAASSEDG